MHFSMVTIFNMPKSAKRMFSIILMINKIRTSMFFLLLVTETTANIHDENVLNYLMGATYIQFSTVI